MLFDFWNSLPSDVRSFLIFGIIGVWNTAFDLALWEIILRLIKPDSALDKFANKIKLNRFSISHAIAFVIANIVSYYLNKNFAFDGVKLKNEYASFGSFFAVSLFSLVISTLLINYLTKNEKIHSWTSKDARLEKWWPQIAKLLVVSITMFTNFFGYKIFVF
ncbi:MAG: hypothetical protein OHK0017_00800 [Patescibacteria group bacterium]